MPHRRRKKKIGIAHGTAPQGTSAAAIVQEAPPPCRREVLGTLFERVLTAVNERVRFTDRIVPMAVFVYLKENQTDLFDMKAVHVRWQSELHKEIIRKKIHDKASVEGAGAVILLMETGPSKGFVLSGATPHLRGHASVGYTYDKQTRVFSFSEMVWHDEPLQNFFLDGIPLRG